MRSTVETLAAALTERKRIADLLARAAQSYSDVARGLEDNPVAYFRETPEGPDYWKTLDDLRALVAQHVHADNQVKAAYAALSDVEKKLVPAPSYKWG